MKEEKKNKEEIRRYLSGEMTREEKNAFEKLMLKDMFLDEAVEGLSGITPEDYENDLKKLNKLINARTKPSRRVIYYRVAASIAILVVASVFLVMEKNRTINIVKEEVQLEIAMNEPLFMPEIQKQQEDAESRKLQEAYPEKKDYSTYEFRSQVEISESVETNVEPSPDIISDDEPDQTRKEADLMQEISERTNAPAAAAPNVRSYRTMIEPESAKGIGRTATDPELNVLSDSVKISLINSNGTTGSARLKSDGRYVPPIPAQGIEAFKTYIRRNFSSSALTSEGDSVIEAGFSVMPDGTIDSIRIKNAAGKAISDEVIRILREGPAWHAAEKDGIAVEDKVILRIELR